MASGGGPMNVDAERGAQLGERRVLGDEAPADPGRVGAALAQRPAELLVVEVGDARAGVAEDDALVGRAHERRAPLVLGVQGDDADPVAVLVVELAHGADQAHGRLAPVHHGDALEHLSDPLSVHRPPVDVRADGSRRCCAPPPACEVGFGCSLV